MSTSHFIENTGDAPPRFLELLKLPHFTDISLTRWMARPSSSRRYETSTVQ